MNTIFTVNKLTGRLFRRAEKTRVPASGLRQYEYPSNWLPVNFRQSLSPQASEKANQQQETRRAIAELRRLDDRSLNDKGMSRNDIETAVRYGRTSIDFEPEQYRPAVEKPLPKGQIRGANAFAFMRLLPGFKNL